MLVRQSALDIPTDNPFRNDALSRDKLEPPLTQFVTQASGPLVLALDGSWGSGKTTFLNMWRVKLDQAGHACLYLNAWKTDFSQKPLVAVVGELSSSIEQFAPEGKSGEPLREHMRKARKIAESIVKRSIPVGVKLATLGILDTQDLAEKIIADFASEIVEDRIKDYEQGKSEIEEFRKTLGSLSKEVSELKSGVSAKVVVIIDELDRCRPIYAVQLLERIKHLFDVSGVVFILGIDRSQLNHSIKALYGTDFDAQGYLKRFIDLDYRLPEPKAGNYCPYLCERFGIDDVILKRKSPEKQYELKNLKSFLGGLMHAAGMSLREQEQTVARLRIVLQTIPPDKRLYDVALSLFLFLREQNYELYLSLLEGKTNLESILNYVVQLPHFREVSQELDLEILEAILIVGLEGLGVTSPQLEEYQKIVNSDSEYSDLSKAPRILELVGYFSNPFQSGGSGFKITAERLALTNSFGLSLTWCVTDYELPKQANSLNRKWGKQGKPYP